jgi:hypothetical protein
MDLGRQWAGDNVRPREGKNPDRRLRPPSTSSVRKDVDVHRQLGGWLRSSHSLKECVIAHQSSVSAPIMVGTKLDAEAADLVAPSGATEW